MYSQILIFDNNKYQILIINSIVMKTDIIDKLFNQDTGIKIFSILLGLGIAFVFKKECEGKNCIVIEGPDPNEVSKYYFKVNGECYQYKPYIVDCEAGGNRPKADAKS
jgi:hypothetical protein